MFSLETYMAYGERNGERKQLHKYIKMIDT